MTWRNRLSRVINDKTRRSFLQKSTAALVGTGVAATSTSTAQEEPPETDTGENVDAGQPTWKALIFADSFHPRARFAIVSDTVDYVPNYGGVRKAWFENYNTRMIRWLNTDEVVPLFISFDAELGQFNQDLGFVTDTDDDPQQPQLYEIDHDFTPVFDHPRLVTVKVTPVDEQGEDAILKNEDWWQKPSGGGADCGN